MPNKIESLFERETGIDPKELEPKPTNQAMVSAIRHSRNDRPDLERLTALVGAQQLVKCDLYYRGAENGRVTAEGRRMEGSVPFVVLFGQRRDGSHAACILDGTRLDQSEIGDDVLLFARSIAQNLWFNIELDQLYWR